MTRDPTSRSDYIEKVREETREYMRDLLHEHEMTKSQLANLVTENDRLRDKIRIYKHELACQVKEQRRLQALLSDAKRDHSTFTERFLEIEQKNNDLANLYVAAYRLHATLDRDQILQTILEIVINMIGSEEVGVFELEPGAKRLRLAASHGLDQPRFENVPLGDGPVGLTAETGQTFIQEVAPLDAPEFAAPDLTACLPLKVEQQTIGVLAIFRLLPQKNGLEPIDLELLDLLADQGAMALFSARLRSICDATSVAMAS
jgi:nitrate/nitrite-specific signal transduction histidine kinase